MISPVLELNAVSYAEVVMDIQTNFNNGAELKLLYSTDNFPDPINGNWQELIIDVPEGSADGFGEFESITPVALPEFAEVLYLPGVEMTPALVRDADVLIIRTRTTCGERLLKGSAVKYIASATIGIDHIDAEYCRKRGIAWSNAPGCNAGAVCQYVAAALFACAQKIRSNQSAQPAHEIAVRSTG